MEFRYGLDERPPLSHTLLYGLQWFAITIPTVVVIGKITGELHFSAISDQMVYLQKSMFVMAVALFAQLMLGHRMPLIVGPSSILLIGIIAGAGHRAESIYTAILFGGFLPALAGATGLLDRLKRLFSPRIVAVVLILIAFTLAPTIMNLITSRSVQGGSLSHLLFTLILALSLFAAYRFLPGIWRSTLIIWTMMAGSLAWFLMFPETFNTGRFSEVHLAAGFFKHMTLRLSFDPGIMVSFLFCFLALLINDLSSIQTMNELLKPADAGRRINHGILITGLSNVLSGFFGVIGPVNFSLSPGVIAATGCASRIAMIPAAVLLLLLSFSPAVIVFIASVPSIVIGTVLIYILTSQIAAGLMTAFESIREFRIADGMILGLPLLLATIIAYLPADFLSGLPPFLQPVLGNGFVVGVTAALVMEHGIFRNQ